MAILKNEYKSDRYEAEAMFYENFGNVLPDGLNYDLLLLGIEEGAKQYSELTDKPKDFLKSIPSRINSRAEEKDDIKRIVDEYASSNESLDLCNNMSYLLFANYMINYNKKMVDENFKKEVEQIIKTSYLLQCIDYVDEEFNRDDYNKLAKYTLKNMKKQERKDVKEEDKALRKVKHFFTNNSNK